MTATGVSDAHETVRLRAQSAEGRNHIPRVFLEGSFSIVLSHCHLISLHEKKRRKVENVSMVMVAAGAYMRGNQNACSIIDVTC